MADIDKVLEERGPTHGDYRLQSQLNQEIQDAMRSKANWKVKLRAEQRDALQMISVKMSRIVTGNPDEADHWDDIAGYATLVSKILTGEKK